MSDNAELLVLTGKFLDARLSFEDLVAWCKIVNSCGLVCRAKA
jgi:hypothetical protein